MRRWLKPGLSLFSLRKIFGFTTLYSAAKFDLSLECIKTINYGNVLVFAPHPDDDVFGLGGTIKKITTSGGRVTVAYFCDGARGVPVEPSLEHSTRKDESLIEVRKAEAQKSAEILGIGETIFWGYPDGKLASGTSVTKAASDLISRIKPDIIFLPSFMDNHPDHRVTNEIFINAKKSLSEDFPIWMYEIWTPIFVNRVIDISLYIKTKQEAMAAHKTQIESRRYDKAIVGLNQYRSEINNLAGFAEGFLAVPYKLYRELYRKS